MGGTLLASSWGSDLVGSLGGVAAASVGLIVAIRSRAKSERHERLVADALRRRYFTQLWAEQVAKGEMTPEEHARRMLYLLDETGTVTGFTDPESVPKVVTGTGDGTSTSSGEAVGQVIPGPPPEPKGKGFLERNVNLLSATIGVLGLLANALLAEALEDDPPPDCVSYAQVLGELRTIDPPIDPTAFGHDGLSFGDLETKCGPPDALFPTTTTAPPDVPEAQPPGSGPTVSTPSAEG